jgi:hypothetical protein
MESTMAFRRISETYPGVPRFLADLASNFQYDSPLNAEPMQPDNPFTRFMYPNMALNNRHKLPLSLYMHRYIRRASSDSRFKIVRLEWAHSSAVRTGESW